MTTSKQRRASLVEEFTENVRNKLEQTGMSYAELAEAAGVSRQYIYQVLDHGQNCSMDLAERIADAIGLKITVS